MHSSVTSPAALVTDSNVNSHAALDYRQLVQGTVGSPWYGVGLISVGQNVVQPRDRAVLTTLTQARY